MPTLHFYVVEEYIAGELVDYKIFACEKSAKEYLEECEEKAAMSVAYRLVPLTFAK